MANNKQANCDGGDLSHVNQIIELEAERPRKIMIEVKVKDMSLFEDEEDDQDDCQDDESIPSPNTSDAPSISEVDHVWPKPGVHVPNPVNISITITDPSPPEEADGSGLTGLPDACNDTNASFKRLLGQWVPQNDERSLRQHFYKYGPPPPVMPLPVAPPSSAESPTDRPIPKDEQVPEDSTISPENESETNENVFEKPPSKADEVLELEKELIRSYNRLDPSKIKTFL